MKKITSLLLMCALLFSLTACKTVPAGTSTPAPEPSETHTPEPVFPEESVKIADLNAHTIVYPSDYEDWQMTEVNLLKTVLGSVTGQTVNAVPDTVEPTGKEIILASSKRQTALSEYVSTFKSRLDYVVGVSDGNVIIGGQDYYGDMRAAYDFINNVLGYDDLTDTYNTPVEAVSGVTKTAYSEPKFTVAAAAFYNHEVPSPKQVKEMQDCHFNAFIMQNSKKVYTVYNEDGSIDEEATVERFRPLCLWCTRFNIRLVLPILLDNATFEFEPFALGAYEDNPIVWGHYIQDEPELNFPRWNSTFNENPGTYHTQFERFAEVGKEYHERYGNKGWKNVINFTFYTTRYESYITGTFADYDVLSFDYYPFEGERIAYFNDKGSTTVCEAEELHNWEKQAAEARKNGQDFWSYITAFYLDQYNTEKMFRWNEYLNMCFNVQGLLYFNYSGWVVDKFYEKIDPYWDYAEQANRQALMVGELIAEKYPNYLGTHEENVDLNDRFMYLDGDYPYFSDIVSDFVVPDKDKSPYLFGLFNSDTDKNDYAFIVMNCSELDDIAYAETTADPIKLKIDGNVTFYLDGEIKAVEKDSDGYYSIMCGNGYSWFVTVDR